MKEFVCNEVAGLQTSKLLKVYFSTFTFQSFIFCLEDRTIYFKVRIFMAAYAIYFFNLHLLPCKRVSKQ